MEKVQDAWVHTVHVRTYVHALHILCTVNVYTYVYVYMHYMNKIHTYVQCICMHICTYATTCIMHTACVGDFFAKVSCTYVTKYSKHMERESKKT